VNKKNSKLSLENAPVRFLGLGGQHPDSSTIFMKALFVYASLLALSACAAGNPVASVPNAAPPAYAAPRHMLHYALTRDRLAQVAPQFFTDVPYQGGAVLPDPKMYLIFWGYKTYGDRHHLQRLLEAYTNHMGGSSHNNIETQYYEESGTVKTYITNPANQYGGSWNDESVVPKTPTDPQIAAEALRGVAHFGYDPSGLYVVMTPHGRSEVGFGTTFCSYHSFTAQKKNLVPYANLPYMTDAGAECYANAIKPPADESGADEGMTIYAGHEYGEAITDPKSFTAWWGESGEIADPCQGHGFKNDTFGTKSYTMQPMVSDATFTCVQGYKSP
jgi:hypothetical protein